ncbi:hypothetical protein DSM104443_01511 [Usitatibacter rugosus]|uniref:Peptidase S8/S53 domain-containing protein n=1 Tax=Usitatibacter rugosus TaxID=2732067 RepID=A0A6M4GY65_9PROT|nr:S8 family serine peptidase [Usitatibacter rugosus]QJR10447.1 hypothetical protein DSM104443_01511 [Usitatibacter rugosus]
MPPTAPAKRQPRPKLDPRLAMLLELDAEERRELVSRELSRIEDIGAELKAVNEDLASFPARAQEPMIHKLREIYGRLFAPMSAGLLAEGALPDSVRKTGDPVFSAFILADATPDRLAALGVTVRSQAGDVFTAFVPQSAIARLEEAPEVRYVELARSVVPTGSSTDTTQVLAPRTAARASPDFNGTGAIVGVIDSTLDLYHPDFRKQPGFATRVLGLWDQTLAPVRNEISPSFGYGVEYTRKDIDDQLSAFPGTPAYQQVRHNTGGEVGSHGTAVAGIATGNGRADPTCVGSAPGADIIFVAQADPHSANALADNVQVMDAFSYIFARAEALGLPCVVNLSNGDNLGSHDGTSMGERFLDALLEKPGRAITLSAGNSTGTACHATSTLAQGTSTTLHMSCDAQAVLSDAVEIWYDDDDRFDVTITVPGPPPLTLTVSPGDAVTAITPSGVQVVVDSTETGISGANRVSVLFLVPAGAAMPQGVTLIEVHATQVNGSGTFHAWIDRNNRLYDPVTMKEIAHVFFTTWVDDKSLTLGTPGTARHAITVGNHDGKVPPQLASTSGLGPTRDGRVKPEVAACGENVRVPWSCNRGIDSPQSLYGEKSGTSFSAPYVAGICACLFQRHGLSLTWAHLKQLLADTAGNQQLTIPDRGFGFGYLQVGPLIGNSPRAVDVWIQDDPSDTGLEPNVATVIWASPDIEILDMARVPVANPSRGPGGAATNIVRVRVRNRGTQVAANTQVHLAWAEGATYVPMDAWQTAGLFVAATGGAFTQPGSTQQIASLPPGQFAELEFGFAPPAGPADRPLTLIVQLQNAQDPWLGASQPWALLGTRNNLAMRTVQVVAASHPSPWTMQFTVAGAAASESTGLEVSSELGGGQVVLRLPQSALPLARRGQVTGEARIVDVAGGEVELTLGQGPLYVPRLVLGPGQPVGASISVTGAPAAAVPRRVHVAQRSGGQIVGGASLEVRP